MNIYRGPEKRTHRRLDVTYLISYKIKNAQEEYNLSRTKNISRSGVLLTTNKSFAKGVIVTMIIRGPFSREALEVTGEIIDSKEVVKNSVYETRIRIVEADNRQLAILDEFIKRRSR